MTDLPLPPPIAWIEPARHAAHPEVARWQADIAAGRIGAPPRPDPAIRATLIADDALFGQRAAWFARGGRA